MADEDFANFTHGAIQDDVPATRAMCVVAYENLRPLMSAAISVAKERGEVPPSVDDFVTMTFDKLDVVHDEIARRRLVWFFLAALVYRLDALAERKPSLIDCASDVWLLLSDAGQYLATLLEHNIVWTDSEKAYFSHLQGSHDGISYVMTIMLPKQYRSQPKLKLFAKSHNVSLW